MCVHTYICRLHYAIQAYREILEYIETMSTSEDASLRENAKIMQSNIFYHSEYRELFISLLRSFTPQRSTKDLLRDVVETLHLYLRMLENYSKGRGRMVVQAKRKKQSQMSHKGVDEHERELDENEVCKCAATYVCPSRHVPTVESPYFNIPIVRNLSIPTSLECSTSIIQHPMVQHLYNATPYGAAPL